MIKDKNDGLNLTDLANRYRTDKGDQVGEKHNYTEYYESIFHPYREAEINLLEIGIFDTRFPCASVKMWQKYFINAEIYGFDIAPGAIGCKTKENIHVFIGDQSKREDLQRFIDESSCLFQIIIDDGSHIDHHQLITFDMLFGQLDANGYYIIEDIHVSPLTTKVFRHYQEHGKLINEHILYSSIETKIKFCEIHNNLIILRKSDI